MDFWELAILYEEVRDYIAVTLFKWAYSYNVKYLKVKR